MCKGPWTLPCIVIPVIIDEISDGGGEQPPPPDIEERAIDTAAALCIAQKNITIKAVNQTASQCIANGGNADVDYGDSCGIGGSVTCMQNGGGRSEEHTSELQSLMRISYAVFCLKKKTNT